MKTFTPALVLGLCCAVLTPGQAVLNLSHDLVSRGIAAHNMTPDVPTLDSRTLFQAGINYASANHIATVTVDRGNYYFLSQTSPYQHVYLTNISNVTVDLQYSDLYFATGNIVAIFATGTTNFTLKNFTVDYLHLPFTQVTVTGVNASTGAISIQPFGNYPLPSYFNSITVPVNYIISGYFMFVFRNGQELRTVERIETSAPFVDTSLTAINPGPGTDATALATIQAGDTIVLTYRAGYSTIDVVDSTGYTLQNVSVYASGFIGVGTDMDSATTIDHVQVIPRPGTDRLISTNADGIHLSLAGANNTVTNNTVKRGCDDAIAIDGQWYAIVNAANVGATVRVARNSTPPLVIGTSFDFININDGTIVGTATIVDETPEPAAQTGAGGELITLTLDHAIPLLPNYGMTPTDPSLRGGGTLISGNLVQQENFVRGIYPAGVKNVTVTDNMIESTNGPGILIEQDEALVYGYKTGPSSGIVVKNNIVDNPLGWGSASGGVVFTGGAINIVAYDSKFIWVPTQPLTNISVTGNFVSNSIRSGVRMNNVAVGTITGNTILNYGTAPTQFVYYVPGCSFCETQAQLEADFTQPIIVANSTGITNSNNTTTGQWLSHTSDAGGGLRIAPQSIGVITGQNLTAVTAASRGNNLLTKLGGVTVNVKDSAGVSRPAGLLSVSPTQIRYLMPAGTAQGVATVMVGANISAAFVAPVGPGLYAASGAGSGVGAATVTRISGSAPRNPIVADECGAPNCAPVPITLDPVADAFLLQLYGTGIRGRSSLANVVASVGGVAVPVIYAGADLRWPGVDRVDMLLPAGLEGIGAIPVVLTVDGITANVVSVTIK